MGRSPRPGVWRAVIRAVPLLGGVVLGLLLMPLMPTPQRWWPPDTDFIRITRHNARSPCLVMRHAVMVVLALPVPYDGARTGENFVFICVSTAVEIM